MKTTPIIAQQTTSQPSQFQSFEPAIAYLKQPGFQGLGILLILVFFLSLLSPKSRGLLADERWGGAKEMKRAEEVAVKQINEGGQNNISCWIGDRHRSKGTIYFNHMEEGTLILGKSGIGKTSRAFDPLVTSAIKQGHPIILYDRKFPEQFLAHAALAVSEGYKIAVFCPGYAGSGRFNIMEMIEDPDDFIAHLELCGVIGKNYNLGASSKGSSNQDFFDKSANTTFAALMMLARKTAYADLPTVLELSKVKDLATLVEQNQEKVGRHVNNAFLQLQQTKESSKTLASILSTVSQTLMRTCNKATEPYISGKTTIPIELKGKVMLVFGFPSDKRDAISPLVTSAIHMIVERNLRTKREEPLFLFLDEVASAYYPNLARWLTEYRSYGLCTVIACQNIAQLRDTYGKDQADIMISNIANKIIFNPGDEETAQRICTILGEREIQITQKSEGYSGGKKNNSHSKQRHKKQLITVAKIMKMSKFKAILICQGFGSQGESFVPIRQKFKLVGTAKKDYQTAKRLWDRKINGRLIAKNNIVPIKLNPRLEAISSLLTNDAGEDEEFAEVLTEVGM